MLHEDIYFEPHDDIQVGTEAGCDWQAVAEELKKTNAQDVIATLILA